MFITIRSHNLSNSFCMSHVILKTVLGPLYEVKTKILTPYVEIKSVRPSVCDPEPCIRFWWFFNTGIPYKNYPGSVSFVEIGAEKAIIGLTVSMNVYLWFPDLLSTLGEIRCERPERNVIDHLSLSWKTAQRRPYFLVAVHEMQSRLYREIVRRFKRKERLGIVYSTLQTRLGGLQSWSGWFGGNRNLFLFCYRDSNPGTSSPLPSAYSDCATAAVIEWLVSERMDTVWNGAVGVVLPLFAWRHWRKPLKSRPNIRLPSAVRGLG
jgi:hypothetical protein